MISLSTASRSGAVGLRLGLARRDDRDLRLVEGGVELVELGRLEVELVERERHLVGVELPGLQSGLEELLRLVARKDVLDRRSSRCCLRFRCQLPPPCSSAGHTVVGAAVGVKEAGKAAQDRALRIVSR